MNRFGKLLVKLGATPPPDDGFWYRPVGSYIAQFAGGESAMRITAVDACVGLRSETIGSLPCQVFRRTGDGKEVDRDHPLYYLLHDSPNDDISAFEFWQTAEQDLCIDGNFYARIETNARNEVSALYPLNPACMDVQRDKQTGLLVYIYREGGETRTYLRDEILHLPGKGFNGHNRLKGMSPIAWSARELEIADAQDSYTESHFKNNATPPSYISTPNVMADQAKFQLLDYMMQRFGGAKNAGKLGILDAGMEIKTVPINHTDMQFIEGKKLSIENIARRYRVPPHKIGELSRSTNNNIEHQGIEWVTDTVRPECTRIEKRLNMQLLGPRESKRNFVEFNLDSMLRGDSAARATFYSSLRNIGAINANEIRSRENLNPYDGGEVYMVQGAMIPVEMAGKQQEQKAVAQ